MISTHAIRTATLEDAPRIAVLGAHVWLQTYAVTGVSDGIARYVLEAFAVDKIRALSADPEVALLVAESRGNLGGYLAMRFNSYHADVANEIETLYIQESLTGRGIGSALLAHAREIAMTRTGTKAVWLAVNSRNVRAISFYQSRGLTQDGVTYFELGGTKHENIVMVAKN